MHPLCMIRDADHYDCDVLDDKEDTEDDNREDPTEDQPITATVPVSDEGAASVEPTGVKHDDNDGYHLRQDAAGRYYKYDVHGNRMYAKPLHGTLKPASIPQSVWRKMTKAEQKDLHGKWKSLEAAASAGKGALGPPSVSEG